MRNSTRIRSRAATESEAGNLASGMISSHVPEVEFNKQLPLHGSPCTSHGTKLLNDDWEPKDLQKHIDSEKPLRSVRHNGTSPVINMPFNDKPLGCSVTYNCTAHVSDVPFNSTPIMCSFTSPPPELNPKAVEKFDPVTIFLPSHPTEKDWSNIVAATKGGLGLTGTAAMAQIGPVLGVTDIGECEDSYLFRVSLPGVKRDEREFSCEVEDDGKVLIRGVTTTGEKTVCLYSQFFEMQSQNLCPSGHFSISFKLPGPVDPQQFSGNFGTDGILEGIVMKATQEGQ